MEGAGSEKNPQINGSAGEIVGCVEKPPAAVNCGTRMSCVRNMCTLRAKNGLKTQTG